MDERIWYILCTYFYEKNLNFFYLHVIWTKRGWNWPNGSTGHTEFDWWLLHLPDIDWLIIYSFTSRSRIFHLYGDITITGEGLQNLGLCSALRSFEQGGIFIVPHLSWHGTSVFPVSSKGPPHSVASYDTRGCGGSILTWILMGHLI
jgi:hypothetical protein